MTTNNNFKFIFLKFVNILNSITFPRINIGRFQAQPYRVLETSPDSLNICPSIIRHVQTPNRKTRPNKKQTNVRNSNAHRNVTATPNKRANSKKGRHESAGGASVQKAGKRANDRSPALPLRALCPRDTRAPSA